MKRTVTMIMLLLFTISLVGCGYKTYNPPGFRAFIKEQQNHLPELKRVTVHSRDPGDLIYEIDLTYDKSITEISYFIDALKAYIDSEKVQQWCAKAFGYGRMVILYRGYGNHGGGLYIKYPDSDDWGESLFPDERIK